jgi:hypothetical protein
VEAQFDEIEWLGRSMRKLLDKSSVAQSLDSGDRLKGSLRFPEEISNWTAAQTQGLVVHSPQLPDRNSA